MQSTQPRPYTFDRVVRMILTALVFGAILYLVNLLKHVLVPFIIAVFIAYLLDPMVTFMQNKARLKHRGLSVIVTVLIVGVGLSLMLIYLIPAFIQEMNIQKFNGHQKNQDFTLLRHMSGIQMVFLLHLPAQ